MSPASRSKPKDKSSARTANAKEQKSSSKVSTPGNTGAGAPASAYNPLLGTFHTLETAPPVSSPPPHSNGRFRNIDETDEHSGSSVGTGAEYDSVSNNDSCSGESEDLKEKMTGTTLRQEAIPGSDNDKREKIRQKNERKHQRQRERRAQELHERCNGYLMSRKLEALAQQLVAMGFSSEKATMALIANEGRIEESVAWLLEGGEEAAQQKDSSNLSAVNLKIDITEELSRIVDMELKYKCSKQELPIWLKKSMVLFNNSALRLPLDDDESIPSCEYRRKEVWRRDMQKLGDFKLPQFFNYPPYFTLQPVKDTREKLVQLWKELIVEYCRAQKLFVIGLEDEFPLFTNPVIERSLSHEAKETFMSALISEGRAEWMDKGHKKCLILWHRIQDWADIILRFVKETGLEDSVMTIDEIRSGIESRGTELRGVDRTVLMRALKILEQQGKAAIFKGSSADDEGVKFST